MIFPEVSKENRVPKDAQNENPGVLGKQAARIYT